MIITKKEIIRILKKSCSTWSDEEVWPELWKGLEHGLIEDDN